MVLTVDSVSPARLASTPASLRHVFTSTSQYRSTSFFLPMASSPVTAPTPIAVKPPPANAHASVADGDDDSPPSGPAAAAPWDPCAPFDPNGDPVRGGPGSTVTSRVVPS